ncbi:CAP domain-containing protein [Coleofasciculus sp. E1-EBD-02]|uniref:CAP domain-containing protein n=1 Tax=Coleofasciculus sp. E1-EBD-02 TaxID=3068481 RepID=UPI0032F456FA
MSKLNSQSKPSTALTGFLTPPQQLFTYLAGAVFLSFLLSSCTVFSLDTSPRPTQEETPTRESLAEGDSADYGITVQSDAIAQLEAKIYQRINEIRQQRGLNQLKINDNLAKLARSDSRKMAQSNFLSPLGIQGEPLEKRAQAAGFSFEHIAENFSFDKFSDTSPSASSIVQKWMDDEGQRESILNSDFHETGIGIWREDDRYYISQIFIQKDDE